jgi:pimeloyl-ACP methyl ester carboxylesterase
MHGNASCQIEGQFLISNVCPFGIAVFLFDFPGCGNSDGDYVSLGFFERADVQKLIDDLSNTFNLNRFILWGRSMGAATALLVHHPKVIGLVVDSAYTSLKAVCRDIAIKQGIPRIFCSSAIWWLSFSVFDTAGFDLYLVRPKDECAKPGHLPIVFGHAPDDELVPFRLGRRLFDVCGAENKKFVELENGHNGMRPHKWYRTCYAFIFQTFGIDGNEFKLVEVASVQKWDDFFASTAAVAREEDGRADLVMVLRQVTDDEEET